MELDLQIILVVTSVLVVLLVLLHRAKGGGLSSLFGGGVQSSLSGSTGPRTVIAFPVMSKVVKSPLLAWAR